MIEEIELAKPVTKQCEGLRLVRYLCPAGYPTIGWGHRCAANQPPIALELAERLIDSDLLVAYLAVLRLCPRAIERPGLVGALTDFVLNLGSSRLAASTLRRVIAAGEFNRVPEEFRKWVWGGGHKLPGLVLRRELDIKLISQQQPLV